MRTTLWLSSHHALVVCVSCQPAHPLPPPDRHVLTVTAVGLIPRQPLELCFPGVPQQECLSDFCQGSSTLRMKAGFTQKQTYEDNLTFNAPSKHRIPSEMHM